MQALLPVITGDTVSTHLLNFVIFSEGEKNGAEELLFNPSATFN